jgi:hypothetical protein
MEVRLIIDHMAIKRLSWKELTNTVELEYKTSMERTLRILKTARKEFGLEVEDGESEIEESQPEHFDQ